jgi:hypothetical protein
MLRLSRGFQRRTKVCEQRRTDLLGAAGEQNGGGMVAAGFVGEEGDIAIWVLTMDDFGAWRAGDPQSFHTDWDAAIGTDGDLCADTPDIGPPWAARGGAQNILLFLPGPACGVIRGAAEFAVDFPGVAMAAEEGQQWVGRLRIGNGFGSEEGGQAALPVLVLPLDFALGLRCAGVAQGDAIKVERRAELGEGGGALGEKHAVTVHVEFAWQTVFGKGGGEEVEVGEQILTRVDRGPCADPGAIIQQVQQRIVAFVPWKPAMRGGVQLPQCPGFEALPAAGAAWAADAPVGV